MNDSLPHSFQCLRVDVRQIIRHGVPSGAETALYTVGIIGYNIYRRDVGNLIERDVVVGNHPSFAHRKIATKPCLAGCLPYFLQHFGRVLSRHSFLIELSALTADHIQQNAETWTRIQTEVACKILGTQRPAIFIVFNVRPTWCTPVFGIETNEVYTDFQLLVGTDQTQSPSSRLRHWLRRWPQG